MGTSDVLLLHILSTYQRYDDSPIENMSNVCNKLLKTLYLCNGDFCIIT